MPPANKNTSKNIEDRVNELTGFNLTHEEILNEVGNIDPKILELAQSRVVQRKMAERLQELATKIAVEEEA